MAHIVRQTTAAQRVYIVSSKTLKKKNFLRWPFSLIHSPLVFFSGHRPDWLWQNWHKDLMNRAVDFISHAAHMFSLATQNRTPRLFESTKTFREGQAKIKQQLRNNRGFLICIKKYIPIQHQCESWLPSVYSWYFLCISLSRFVLFKIDDYNRSRLITLPCGTPHLKGANISPSNASLTLAIWQIYKESQVDFQQTFVAKVT